MRSLARILERLERAMDDDKSQPAYPVDDSNLPVDRDLYGRLLSVNTGQGRIIVAPDDIDYELFFLTESELDKLIENLQLIEG